jgi:phosphoglucomutase
MAYEESIGYMVGSHVADKDAVTAAMLLTQMCAMYVKQGITPLDRLNSLFEKFGWYGEDTISIYMTGSDGKRRMNELMDKLRNEPPKEIAGVPVELVQDYLTGKNTTLSGSDVLCFILLGQTKIFIRPSGTEPKIKIYVMVKGKDRSDRDEKLAMFIKWAKEIQQSGEI